MTEVEVTEVREAIARIVTNVSMGDLFVNDAVEQILARLSSRAVEDELSAAAKVVIERWAETEPHLNNLCAIGHLHSAPYTGPNFGETVEALAAAIRSRPVIGERVGG